MSWRKGSNASVDTSQGSNGSRAGAVCTKPEYPFALALRIKVVQIVCGIAAVVMGSVAAIEERRNFNLSLGVPAGLITVLVSSWSVHRSLHRSSASRRLKTWLSRLLWAVAVALHGALFALSAMTLARREMYGSSAVNNTSLSLAGIMSILSLCTLAATSLAIRLRVVHGPPPSGPLPRHDRCPRSTSHTGVSMVPLASNYPSHAVHLDNISRNSDNEVMEITVAELDVVKDSSRAGSSPRGSPRRDNRDSCEESDNKSKRAKIVLDGDPRQHQCDDQKKIIL